MKNTAALVLRNESIIEYFADDNRTLILKFLKHEKLSSILQKSDHFSKVQHSETNRIEEVFKNITSSKQFDRLLNLQILHHPKNYITNYYRIRHSSVTREYIYILKLLTV